MAKGKSKLSKSNAGGAGTPLQDKIEVNEKMLNNPKYEQPLKVLNTLYDDYNTKLQTVSVGAEKAAGDVDITGQYLRINTSDPYVATHEFAHTLANTDADKYGLTNNKAFWGEIRKIRTAYRKDVAKDYKKQISSYADSKSGGLDEFFAEAFAQAKGRQMGLSKRKKGWETYGDDYTYSNQVLAVVDKYFKKKK